MGKEIDIAKRKPRQTRGTPAYWAANRFALGVISLGILIGFGIHYFPPTRHFSEKTIEYFDSQKEEIELKQSLMSKSLGRSLRLDEWKKVKDASENISDEIE